MKGAYMSKEKIQRIGQNDGPIMLGRKKTMKLVVCVIPELKQEVLG